MIGLIIVTHGNLAEELIEAASRAIGHIKQLEGISFGFEETPENLAFRIESAIRMLDKGDGVLLFSDLLGGTSCTVCGSFINRYKVEVITGVNLPMIIKGISYLPAINDLKELTRLVEEGGRNGIVNLRTRLSEGR